MSMPITPLSAARLLLSTLLKRPSSKPAPKHTRAFPTLPLPPVDDHDAWRAYWKAQGQPWRTEPEIDKERQEYLAGRRAISPNIKQDIYPFKDIKLSRADVEWLLATLDGRGPVNWDDGSQRKREGLDLRGANLSRVDLQNLPLSRMHGGLTVQEWDRATAEQREAATIHLEGANLLYAHVEEAFFRGAHLEGANLRWICLEGASLGEAHLEGANLRRGRLKGAFLQNAHLEGADLYAAHLEGVSLSNTCLAGKLTSLNILEDMRQYDIDFPTVLPPANLQRAFFDSGTNLRYAKLGNNEHGFVTLADVHWDNVNLAVVQWSQVDMLGDEYKARHQRRAGRAKDKATRLYEYETAVRANRQLAVALQDQGINEVAAYFVYRAQVLQRKVLWLQRSIGKWLFSWFLFLLAGYGYKPGRSFLAYLFVISIFMTIYHLLDPHLAWNEAFVVSMTAFHGRGFSPSEFQPGDPLSLTSAVEAFVGLIIEVTFIATLTQRFFSK